MKEHSSLYTITFILIICVLFGTGISAVHHATLGMLKKNETLHKNKILSKAFMLSPESESPEAYQKLVDENLASRRIKMNGKTTEIIKNKQNGDIGFVFRGPGFWDAITGVMVLSQDLAEVKNIQILDQKETPGLGARIEESAFTDSFRGLNIDWNRPIKKRIVIGQSPDPNIKKVDAITGATQTSLALMKTINSELENFHNVVMGKD